MWNITNENDVLAICSLIIGNSGRLMGDEGDRFKFYTNNYGEYHRIYKKTIEKLIDKDNQNRSTKECDFWIGMGSDLDYHKLDVKLLRKIKDSIGHFGLVTPSKILAPVTGLTYESDTTAAWQYNTRNVLKNRPNMLVVGTPIADAPFLSLDTENTLIYNYSKDFVNKAKSASKVYVLDNFQAFLFDMEGIKAEVVDVSDLRLCK